MTRWLSYLLNIGPFTTIKICPISKTFAQLGYKNCPLQNKPSKNSQSFAKVVKFRQIWSHKLSQTFRLELYINIISFRALSFLIAQWLLHKIWKCKRVQGCSERRQTVGAMTIAVKTLVILTIASYKETSFNYSKITLVMIHYN